MQRDTKVVLVFNETDTRNGCGVSKEGVCIDRRRAVFK